jgi:diguanylate cyclase
MATASAAAPQAAPSATALAKAAFRRLAQSQLEPTPENYARAYAEESGQPLPPAAAAAASAPASPTATTASADAAATDNKADGPAWAALVGCLARNLERGGKQWTAARRKQSLQRVLDGSRSDPQRLLQRLQSLMGAWEADTPSDPAHTGVDDPPIDTPAQPETPADRAGWNPLLQALGSTVLAGLPPERAHAARLAESLAAAADAVAAQGATPERVLEIETLCVQARRVFGHRHHLVEGLAALCQELTGSLAELAEDDSWVRGQCEVLQVHLGLPGPAGDRAPGDGGTAPAAGSVAAPADHPSTLTVRGVRAARTVLAETRDQQQRLRAQRLSARDALKQLIQSMLLEVGELGEQTGRFQVATARHVQAIAQADTLESLAGVVHALLDDARQVQSVVSRAQQRLLADRERAQELENRVRELEAEMRRLSEEVSTDALTQVANRRGLTLAFDAEVARNERQRAGAPGGPAPLLAVALIDIDNFKKLNDTLGHAAGDVALKRLAAAVRERLRPADHLARFGGEEFVVLLPGTPVEEAQQALTRLQRSLTEALFLHDGHEVFVTFSAGVTAWRTGEALQPALERADEALYEAKRAGKNRTCIG